MKLGKLEEPAACRYAVLPASQSQVLCAGQLVQTAKVTKLWKRSGTSRAELETAGAGTCLPISASMHAENHLSCISRQNSGKMAHKGMTWCWHGACTVYLHASIQRGCRSPQHGLCVSTALHCIAPGQASQTFPSPGCVPMRDPSSSLVTKHCLCSPCHFKQLLTTDRSRARAVSALER